MFSSKDDGGIVGLVSKSDGSDLVELGEAVLTTSAEEALICISDDGTKLVFSSKIDPLSGSLKWFQNEDDDLIMQRTIGMSQMKSMLSDNDRNNVYESAIKICLENYITKSHELPSVLDIGTGTGLLAMLCTRHNAQNVIGCEMFESMASIAQDVIIKNNLQDRINIIPQKSTDIGLEDEDKADILVSELLDSALLGESCIFSHGDAIARLLKTSHENIPLSQRIIPYDADVYATLVESNDIRNMHDVSNFSNIYKINPWRDEDAKDCNGGWNLIPVHWKEALETRNARHLSSPKPILNVNFTNAYNDDDDDDDDLKTGFPFGLGCYETEIVADKTGSLDGILLWWKLKLLSPELDPDRKVIYSTEPGAQNWQDHWLQVVYPLPKSFQCQEGEQFIIKASHDTIKISLQVDKVIEENTDSRKRAKFDTKEMVQASLEDTEIAQCRCGWHHLCGPERLLMLNDSFRAAKYEQAINVLISKFCDQDKTSIIFDTGDGSFISMLAGIELKRRGLVSGAIKIVSKESQQFSRIFHDQLIESNELENVMMLWDGDNFDEVLNIIYDEVDIDNSSAPSSQIIYALISECFQYQLTALPVWQALSFYYERIHYDSLLTDNAIIMPAKGYIMVAAIELESLHISHGNAEIVSGFDHTPLDERQINWHQNLFPFNLAKYGKKLLSKPMIIAELDYTNPNALLNDEKTTIILENGRIDCIAIWVDYNLIENINIKNWNGKDFELHHKSNLKFFPKPINVTPTDTLQSNIKWSDDKSDFIFNFNII